jgi:hypothetical protein
MMMMESSQKSKKLSRFLLRGNQTLIGGPSLILGTHPH